MKKKIPLLILTLASIPLLLWNFDVPKMDGGAVQDHFVGKVESVSFEAVDEYGGEFQVLEVSANGERYTIRNSISAYTNPIVYKAGEKVTLLKYEVLGGGTSVSVTGRVRTPALFYLFLVFVLTLLIVNGRKGLLALLSLAFSFLVIFKLVLPLILSSVNPILAALAGSALILPVSFMLSHGVNTKSKVAVWGTLITLALTGVLSMIFSETLNLTGLSSEEAGFLSLIPNQNINFKGLLLAGVIIGVLGVLDDVTITQASVVQELKNAHPKISDSKLFAGAMRVGRDHISSVVNTLVLVYTGASLPLLLLFYGQQNTNQVLNYEFVAEEIMRTLVGSMGLILAVPITSLIAVMLIKRESHS